MADLNVLEFEGERKGKVLFRCAHCGEPAARFRSQAKAKSLFCSRECVSAHGITTVRCCWPGCEEDVPCRTFDRKRKGGRIVREYKIDLHRTGVYTKYVLCAEHKDKVRTYSGSDGRFTNGRHKLLANPDAVYDVRAASSRFLRFVLFEKANSCCENCKKSLQFDASREWQVDHIVPVCDGGKTKLSNLQILCKSCHDEKSVPEKSRANKERFARTKANRWFTHSQKDDLIARLRARLEALGAPTD